MANVSSGHRAALLDQVNRRARLFTAMAQTPATRASSWQLGNQDRLSDYMEDVEDVDYERLRVGMPAAVLMAGMAALAAATAWLSPLALVPIALLSIAMVAALRGVVPVAGKRWATVRSSQRAAGRLLGAALASVVPLQAERAFSAILNIAFAHFSAAEAGRLAQRRALAVLDMLAGLAGPLAALSVLVAAWHAGDRGSALLVPAFLGFGWLALGETAHNVSRMVLGRVRERAAREGLKDWSTATAAEDIAIVLSGRPATVDAQECPAPGARRPPPRPGDQPDLPRRPPDSPCRRERHRKDDAAQTDRRLDRRRQQWPVHRRRGRDARRLPPRGVASLPARCRHPVRYHSREPFRARRSEAECWLALATVELDGRFADGLDSWISQDMLSLGEAQRLNLARALLSDAPLVLLDEPVEHLDFDQAARILQRVLSHLTNRIVIYSSHAEYAVPGTVSIRIGADRDID